MIEERLKATAGTDAEEFFSNPAMYRGRLLKKQEDLRGSIKSC